MPVIGVFTSVIVAVELVPFIMGGYFHYIDSADDANLVLYKVNEFFKRQLETEKELQVQNPRKDEMQILFDSAMSLREKLVREGKVSSSSLKEVEKLEQNALIKEQYNRNIEMQSVA